MKKCPLDSKHKFLVVLNDECNCYVDWGRDFCEGCNFAKFMIDIDTTPSKITWGLKFVYEGKEMILKSSCEVVK